MQNAQTTSVTTTTVAPGQESNYKETVSTSVLPPLPQSVGQPTNQSSQFSSQSPSQSSPNQYNPDQNTALVHTEVVPVTTDDKKGVKGFLSKVTRPFKYQGKRHGVMASEFTHDSAVAEDINSLRNFSREYNSLSRNVDALLDTEKTYSVSSLRNGHRLVESTHQFHTSRVANHIKGYSELQLQLAQLHSNYVSNNLNELTWFLRNFNKSNIKNSKLLKHELNIAAMTREEYVRTYTSKAEKESKNYFNEKHDDLGLRLAEERKIMSQHQYETAAQKLESSIMDLYEFEARELVPQLQTLIEAQKQYYSNALNLLNSAQQTINSLPIDEVTLPLQRKGSLHNATLPVLAPAVLPTGPAVLPGSDVQPGTTMPLSNSNSNMQGSPSIGSNSGTTYIADPNPSFSSSPSLNSNAGYTPAFTPSYDPNYNSSSPSMSNSNPSLAPASSNIAPASSTLPPSTVYASSASDDKPREQKIEELQQQLGGTGISQAKFVHNA